MRWLMELIKTIFKTAFSIFLVISGILLAGTVVASKKVDDLGDKLQDKIHR